jgi:hypothetical protein
MAISDIAVNEIKKEAVKKDESAFTQILAKASDDSTLLEKPDLSLIHEEKKDTVVKEAVTPPAPKPEEKKNEIVEEKPDKNEKIEQPSVLPKEETQVKIEKEKPAQKEFYKKSDVTRKSESSTSDGFGLVYIDEYANGTKDTVRIFIPQPKESFQPGKNETKEERKFLDIPDSTAQTVKQAPAETKTAGTEIVKSVINKNNCTSAADESDFFRLRKKIAGETGDDNMIGEARKVFKSKCFTAGQIKNLSLLFLTDAGKYKFFDAAYSYVSDMENFASLQAELKDEYYINRFKVMLR